jgi:hypothetical protein
MGYDRQASAEGLQNPRLDVAVPFRGTLERRGNGGFVGERCADRSARAIGLGGARGICALRGVANVMVAGLFAIEALYEGRAVQSLAPGAPTDASRDCAPCPPGRGQWPRRALRKNSTQEKHADEHHHAA